jgi:hypothetical protein
MAATPASPVYVVLVAVSFFFPFVPFLPDEDLPFFASAAFFSASSRLFFSARSSARMRSISRSMAAFSFFSSLRFFFISA